MSPVRYELSFYTLEDDILHSHGRETSYLTKPSFILFCENCLCVRQAFGMQCRYVDISRSRLVPIGPLITFHAGCARTFMINTHTIYHTFQPLGTRISGGRG
jgi:hypothetical protein